MRRTIAALVAATLAVSAPAAPAFAWGNTGHRMIGVVAAESLPNGMAPFLYGKTIPADLGELSREPDRLKGASKASDNDWSPAHFLDLSDDGSVLGGPLLSALPANRQLYDTALRAAGTDSWKAGYLPYSIIETFQQVQLEFAYWRIADAGSRLDKDKTHRAWLKADAKRRQALILRDLGFLSHYVGDGSQPLHVTLHFNGWGDFPNPQGFTTDKIHAPFESDFVTAHVKPADIKGALSAFHDCGCPIEQRTAAYLAVTAQHVVPLYALWKDGGFNGTDPRGVAFAVERLAAGASELRDLISLAWTGSATTKVGYPSATFADVAAGKADAYKALHGAD